jgi:type IV secretion system protein VirB4
MLGDRGVFESAPDDLLPYWQHIKPGVVALSDGSLLAQAALPGLAFELEGHAERNARPLYMNSMLQMLSDDNVTFHVNFVHAEVEPQLIEDGHFQTTVSEDIYRKYERMTFGNRVMENVWIISIIVHPRIPFEGTFARVKRKWLGSDLMISEESERQVEDIMENVRIWLGRYGARRLGYRYGTGEHEGWTYTEIGEALALIMTGRRRVIPLTNGMLGGSVYIDPVVFGGWRHRHHFAIETPGDHLEGVIYSYKDYPSKTQPGMFNGLVGLDFPVVMTHSGRFMSRISAAAKMQLKETQMKNAEDKAVTLLEGLIKLQDKIASSEEVLMSHHFSLAVYGTRDNLPTRATRVSNIIAKGGSVLVREARGLMGAYFTQLPGARGMYVCRPGAVSSTNLACMASLEGYPRGAEEGHWGGPTIQFLTNGGTIYDWIVHVGEVGHTGFWGHTGLGKSLFMSFTACALQRTLSDTDTMVIFDKDMGMAPMVLGNGGQYVCLRRGTASGSAPLRIYDDTPRNVGHLAALFIRLIMEDGRGELKPWEEDMMHRGISRQLKLPVHLRSMLGVKAFLGIDPTGAGARFAKWCRGGVFGWLFDNDEDHITVDRDTRLLGIDFTDLLPGDDKQDDDGCAGAMAADLMFRLKNIMDGRRFVVMIDECRYYADTIAGIMEDLALTGRKKELVLMLAAQQPGHLLERPYGRSILAQVLTDFALPDTKAEWKDYGREGRGYTQAEYRFIKARQSTTTNVNAETRSKRQVLIRRDGESVVVQFDLTGMDDEIAILSGRPDTSALMMKIVDELGPGATPEDITSEFKRRWRSVKRVARKVKEVEEELV